MSNLVNPDPVVVPETPVKMENPPYLLSPAIQFIQIVTVGVATLVLSAGINAKNFVPSFVGW